MDLWILALPVRLMLSIPRPPHEKLALYVIFSLGVISMVASILRLQALRIFTLSTDPLYDSLPINTWSMVEVNVGLLCACIPTLKPLFSLWFAKVESSQATCFGAERANGGERSILQTGKDLIISLQITTLKSSIDPLDEEWGTQDRPPPPPPKDEKWKVVRNVVRYSTIAFRQP